MKIAICFFGLSRFYKSWKNYFYSFYDGCEVDFYGHFWESGDFVEEELKSEFDFKTCIIEPQKIDFLKLPASTDYSKISKGVFETLSPLYSLKRVGQIISNFEKKYDFIVVTRTDVGCNDNTKFLEFGLDKEKIIKLCSTYDNLTRFIVDDKISLCHHRMFFHSMKEYKENIEMLNVDPSCIHGGWFFNRNEKISLT